MDYFAAVGALFTTDDTRLTHKPYPAGNGRVAEPKIVTAHRPDITVRFVRRDIEVYKSLLWVGLDVPRSAC